ncbi:Bodo-specific multi-copy gene family, putative [Bodo saltans]|uniref:Bodo-specific multi-copy gene family, putative n=1 Tax=Bodo saltans TaxID=75058 RepID=A0A0S4JGR3_BODSA|nr:Bodo-specific multi-copy gene family, putative [Bodo saltans]|eukprot:CUG89377.1 Bodo-specific multi-copy gene family, putative [Bodo saltans]
MHDHKSLELLLPRYVKGRAPPEVDAEDYFTLHAPHTIDTIPLQASLSWLSALDSALLPKPGAEVRNIVSCPGGACLLKHFVLMKRLHAMRSGRVIVRRCNFFGHEGPLFPPWLAGISNNQPKNKVLCDLIRTHVTSVTGWPQDPRHYRDDPQAACAMWMSETARHFQISNAPQENMEPLILLLDCEALANCPHTSLVHKSTGDLYSQLEGFCLDVPSPFSIFVDAPINASDPIFLSRANVTHVHLRPQSR